MEHDPELPQVIVGTCGPVAYRHATGWLQVISAWRSTAALTTRPRPLKRLQRHEEPRTSVLGVHGRHRSSHSPPSLPGGRSCAAY
jgi:hypothetical protein